MSGRCLASVRLVLVHAIVATLLACGTPVTPHDASSGDGDATVADTSLDTPTDTSAADGSDASGPCRSDLDCDDGLFCNGVERCAGMMAGADPRGCVPANPTNPCVTETCDEALDRCLTPCDVEPDADHDTVRSVACGGTDCDDHDPAIHPGAMEFCDPAGVDEDCDPMTFGFRDGDSDGYADARCCNMAAGAMPVCGDDCNDSRPNVHPALADVCDGLDNDCNGMIDEGVTRTFYPDRDNDGFGDPSGTPVMACNPPPGYVEPRGDCNDSDGAINPATPEVCDAAMVDENCDGMANPASLCTCSGTSSRSCALPGACAAGTERCIMGSWGACSITPVAEVCNGVDDDCDGTTDEGVSITCYADSDNDGYPTPGAAATAVCPTLGRDFVGGCPPNLTNRAPVGTDADCNDTNASISPGAAEVCDAAMVDENCDGAANPMTLCMCSGSATRTCPLPGACAAGAQTCMGGMWSACSIGPITESCNGVDDDCDGMVDEGLVVTCYADDDNDTYAATGTAAVPVCPVMGRSSVGGCPTNQTNRAPVGGAIDCAPTDPSISPGAVELCDPGMVDENCDGMANPGCACTTGGTRSCALPGACAAGTQSCVSGAWGACSISPVAEACNGADDDCDGSVDEGLTVDCYADSDNDTYPIASATRNAQCPNAGRMSVGGCAIGYTNRVPGAGSSDCDDTNASRNPSAAEVCNAIDDNCDGTVDETLQVTCYADGDGDSYAPAGASAVQQCPDMTRPGGCPVGLTNRAPTSGNIDCADGNAAINPATTEVCNGADDNCNGAVDESLRVTCYPDMDGDTYAPASSSMTYCPQPGRESVGGCPSGFTNRAPGAGSSDCNDSNPLVNPSAAEVCDGPMVDENCDGAANPPALCSCSGSSSRSCPLPGACAAGTQTCSSGSWGPCSISPTTEICDGVDNDCDGTVDESLRVTCYADADDDGYAAAGATAMAPICPVAARPAVGGCPVNTTNRAPVAGSIDCADADPARNPAATDACNGVDDNCNGTVDDTTSADASCTAPNAYSACRGGSCVIIGCDSGHADCNGMRTDGCEVTLNTASNCGACGLSCGVAGTCVGSSVYGGRCTTVTGVAASLAHTCAWRENGTIACWGSNSAGQLGNGATGGATVIPVQVATIATAAEVVTGSGFTCARTTAGAVFCWGANTFGQLGNGTTTASSIPVQVSGITTATHLSAGNNHACARLADSSIRCWGVNSAGQLGNGTTTNASSPVTVAGITTAAEVAAGATHSCARLASGVVRCWGGNVAGQLGNGTTTDSSTPVAVSTLTNATQLALGASHSCARVSGQIYCWGWNASGQLGDGTITNRTTPVQAMFDATTGFTSAFDLAGGSAHTCALDTSPTGSQRISCWGGNSNGQLGDGTTTNRMNATPLLTVTDASGIAISSAATSTCVRRATDQLLCWGANSNGEVGNGSTSASITTPTTVLNQLPPTVLDHGGGASHSCARLANGRVMCWGANTTGALGDGTTTDHYSPALVANVIDAAQLAVGSFFACARRTNGQVQCWGQNTSGQLGDGTGTNSPSAVPVSGLSNAVEIDAGDTFMCARRSTNDVVCWGADGAGQLGDGAAGPNRLAPGATVTGVTNAIDLGVGAARHACARLQDGRVMCWGDNANGQIGNGSASTGLFAPNTVSGLNDALELDAGSDFSCIRHVGGTVGCWGAGTTGQIGDGTGMTRRSITTTTGLSSVSQLAVGANTSCARSGASLSCWGANSFGQIGDGTTINRFAPVALSGTNWVGAGSGWYHMCGTRTTTASPLPVALYCWGSNSGGQIGNGAMGTSVAFPTATRSLP